MSGDSNRSISVSIQNQTHVYTKYILTVTVTIASQKLTFLLNHPVYGTRNNKSGNIRQIKVSGGYFKVRKYETLQQNNIHNVKIIKEDTKALSECVKRTHNEMFKSWRLGDERSRPQIETDQRSYFWWSRAEVGCSSERGQGKCENLAVNVFETRIKWLNYSQRLKTALNCSLYALSYSLRS